MANSGDVLAAIRAGDVPALTQIIASDPSLAQARDENGVSALMNAIYHRQHDMAGVLLATGMELDVFEAAALGHTAGVDELVQQDPALANALSPDGFTALHLACFFGQEAVARQLLAAGADPAAVANNSMRVQPLHSAAAARQTEIVRMLLAAGAPANAVQQAGWTALHEAARRGDLEMADLLLRHGADPLLANDEGKTAVTMASEGGHARLLDFFNASVTRRRAAS